MVRISLIGSFRSPVVIVGPLAFKFAKNDRGRACNLYEADLYRKSNDARRALLCPTLWVSPKGKVLIMRAAEPLSEEMTDEELDEAFKAWDYGPGEDSCPFESQARNWGWLKGRKVALDYSTPALDDDNC
ncbi:hypothetical protein P0R31_30255 [Bradyrhizobium yuanmingense]|uniref:hypothetical protein n=1 Tax=Bradyrhizobium yuanmingense TaxID=108015 RepID=UPI0023BA2FB0|nr:hypothetical protein [Bradyrhizobium yuanmingense]MDF0521535.1 hypothetical protein [Bradyrhizobium yuanmingense]